MHVSKFNSNKIFVAKAGTSPYLKYRLYIVHLKLVSDIIINNLSLFEPMLDFYCKKYQ